MSTALLTPLVTSRSNPLIPRLSQMDRCRVLPGTASQTRGDGTSFGMTDITALHRERSTGTPPVGGRAFYSAEHHTKFILPLPAPPGLRYHYLHRLLTVTAATASVTTANRDRDLPVFLFFTTVLSYNLLLLSHERHYRYRGKRTTLF